MSTVEKKGASWPGIGFALGGGAGLAVGAILMVFTADSALWIATGAGALGGMVIGSFAAYRAQRN
jgi:hypothetical protein